MDRPHRTPARPRASRRGGFRRIGVVVGGIEDIRRVWWSQIRQGNRLPAQIGIILILGDKP